VKKFIAIFFLGLIVILFLKNNKEIITSSLNVKKEEPKQEDFYLISTGDIGLVRDVDFRIREKNDPNYPFLNIADYLRDADLTIANLEGPLIKNCPVIREGFTFCGKDINALGLKYAGIDAVSLANNHATNFGLEGLRETVSSLEANGVAFFGLENEIKYLNIKDKKIALVGFVELGNNWGGLSNATEENITTLITLAKKNSDITIATFHWGNEYVTKPSENQIRLAHLAIDSGADIVLGNHAHWIQTEEVYKEKLIIYAQGNTIFDQDWSLETREGVLYKFVFKEGKFEKTDEKYTIIDDNSQPRFANDEEVKSIKNKLSAE
jgi:gamma-polyglutamate biosynthesis protein CapA